MRTRKDGLTQRVQACIPLDVAQSHSFEDPNGLFRHLIFLKKTSEFTLVQPHANALAADISVHEVMRKQDESCADSDAMV